MRIFKSRVGLGLNGLEIEGSVVGEAPRAGLPVGLKRSQEVSRRHKVLQGYAKWGLNMVSRQHKVLSGCAKLGLKVVSKRHDVL